MRATDVTEDCAGGTDILVLSHYPIESVASIGLQEAGESVFTTQTEIVDNIQHKAGIVWLATELGTRRALIRATYTGGYWYDPSDDGTGTLPTGATLLPADLKEAWFLACRTIWTSLDIKGVVHTGAKLPGYEFINTRIASLEMPPVVKAALEKHRRFLL